jgi:hypothetical protein
MRVQKYLVALAMGAILSACGGGGGGSAAPVVPVVPPPVVNAVPVANAGTLQNVIAGTTVTLDGAGSDGNGDALTYSWTLVPPVGSSAQLVAPTTPKPTFVADAAGTYVASLTVNDGKANSVVSNVTVTAAMANVAPVANAGIAQNVTTGSLVTLDGSASSDANSDPLTGTWTLLSKPAGSLAALAAATTPAPSFTADVPGAYVVSLVVNDGHVDSLPASVTVTAATLNAAPVANAGPAQNVLAGTLVTLNGTGSTDANADPLTDSWTLTSKPAGSTASLSNAQSTTPSFTADAAGIYVVSLVVNDGKVNSSLSTVTVTVAPLRLIGAAYQAPNGLTVTLVAAASTDLGNGYIRYTATVKQTNLTTSALSDSYVKLWFTNGQQLMPGIFASQNVLPGEAFSVFRNYQYDAPSSWVPSLWEYDSDFFSTLPNPSLIEWYFPLTGP